MAESNKITEDKIKKGAVSAKRIAATTPRNQGKSAQAALKALLEAVKKAQDAGIVVKGVYSLRNEDGTTDNGSLKG